MPYIEQGARTRIEDKGGLPETAGELNFVLTNSIVSYWMRMPKSYQSINDIIGALEGAKQEFYRRIAVPYEDRKIQINGDVYP